MIKTIFTLEEYQELLDEFEIAYDQRYLFQEPA